MEKTRRISLKPLGSNRVITGIVRDLATPIGRVAGRAAPRFGMAGTFQILDGEELVDPTTPVADLPESGPYTLSPQLTPAETA